MAFQNPKGGKVEALRVFSHEGNAEIIEPLAKPLSRPVAIATAGVAAIFFLATYFMDRAFPLRSLGVSRYSAIVAILFCACIGLMFAETWQLYRVWGKLRPLLVYLDYIPLRRTLAALHGFSWGRVWQMSGNVLDVRYKLLSRQLECRNHLAASLKEKIEELQKDLTEEWTKTVHVLQECESYLISFQEPSSSRVPLRLDDWNRSFSSRDHQDMTSAISAVLNAGDELGRELQARSKDEKKKDRAARTLLDSWNSSAEPLREFQSLIDVMSSIRALQDDSMKLAQWYAEQYSNPKAGDLSAFTQFQTNSAKAAGLILSRVLIPQWRKEEDSLVIASHDQENNEGDRHHDSLGLAKELYIRNSEEFVSFPFLGFVQNILGRMRTIVMGILMLFIAITLAVSSYPFDPRHAINVTLVGIFVILGSAITYVYADMHRDATLSRLTNTNPGELGSDFWFKILGFGIGPIIGLMTTLFPEIGDFVISWIQPGINSIK